MFQKLCGTETYKNVVVLTTFWDQVGEEIGAKREEQLLSADEVAITWRLRRALAGLDTQQALDVVLRNLKETQSNVEFLVQIQKSVPATSGHGNGHQE